MKIEMLGDRVLAQPVPTEEVTEGGIVIPEVAKGKPKKAVVVSVGPGRVDEHGKLHPIPLEEGDTIMFVPHGPTELKIDGQLYLVLRTPDILGVDIDDG